MLDRYFDYVQGLVREALADAARGPRARLRRYLDIITDRLEARRLSPRLHDRRLQP